MIDLLCMIVLKTKKYWALKMKYGRGGWRSIKVLLKIISSFSQKSGTDYSDLSYCMMTSCVMSEVIKLSSFLPLSISFPVCFSFSVCLLTPLSLSHPLSVCQYVFSFTSPSRQMLCIQCLPFLSPPIFPVMSANAMILRKSTWTSPEAITFSLLQRL